MKRALILGSGISGIGAAKLLRKLGTPCLLSDTQPLNEKKAALLTELGVGLHQGAQSKELLQEVDQIIISPGIPLSIPIIRDAKRFGIPVISDVELARQHFSGEMIAVTGTNGKSTTVELITHLLKKYGVDAAAVGNVGLSPCELLASGADPEIMVIELSSYQLETCYKLDALASVFTSFAPDHLARHGNLENYFLAKWRLYSQTKAGGSVIFSSSFYQFLKNECPQPERNDLRSYVIGSLQTPKSKHKEDNYKYFVRDCSERPSSRLAKDEKTQLSKLSEDFSSRPNEDIGFLKESQSSSKDSVIIHGKSYRLPNWGSHNKINLIFAIIACLKSGITLDHDLRPALEDFTFLPFRFEKIGLLNGFRVINDSKATNVEATLVAMESMPSPYYLLLGGQGKGESFARLNEFKHHVIAAFCFGASSHDIAQQINFAHQSCHDRLEDAVHALLQSMQDKPGAILFSPACASFDEFKDFEHRGRVFNQLFANLSEFKSCPPPHTQTAT